MEGVQYYYAAYQHCEQCVQYYGAVYEKAPAAQVEKCEPEEYDDE